MDNFFAPLIGGNLVFDGDLMNDLDRNAIINSKIFDLENISSIGEDEKLMSNTNKEEIEEEETEDIKNINEVIQKSKNIIKENLDKYNELKDEELSYRDVYNQIIKDFNGLKYTYDNIKKRLEDKINENNKEFYENKFSILLKIQQEIEEDLTENFSKHIINLQKESNKCKKKLRHLSTFYNLSKKLDYGYTCPICYNKEISMICVPCGHSFCSGCLQAGYCYLCRTKIEKKQPIFFS